jgi:SpoVK/Ycf46/Vps4 family AAA+-type ATPase
MFTKRNYTLNPTRIHNYNKFLTTLDNNNLNPQKNKISAEELQKMQEEDIIKRDIDIIIDNIEKTFHLNNMSSSNFTGQTEKDKTFIFIEPNDPNLYINFLNTQLNVKLHKTMSHKPFVSPIQKDPEPAIKIRETIYIDVEINNIGDLLKLINTYKADPEIAYNINMNALHSIKEPLEELNDMIGMNEFKNNIVDQILYFIQELHKNKDSSGEFLHTVIYGPPGTGKTEVAKIIGKIYSKIGILSSCTFKKVTRSDLVAGYLGQTALKTREVIKESLGGVLFIDEAYSLGNPEKKDSFSKECIDVLCEALSDNKECLMVIIAGYEKELKDCFFSLNQGLDSRFTWRFKMDDYTHEDLYHIFLKKVKDIGWEIDNSSSIPIGVDWFKINKDCFTFYGRDIETLLSKIKIAHSRRVFCRPESEKKKLTIKDLDKGFEMYLKNNEIKSKRDAEALRRQLYNSIYC